MAHIARTDDMAEERPLTPTATGEAGDAGRLEDNPFLALGPVPAPPQAHPAAAAPPPVAPPAGSDTRDASEVLVALGNATRERDLDGMRAALVAGQDTPGFDVDAPCGGLSNKPLSALVAAVWDDNVEAVSLLVDEGGADFRKPQRLAGTEERPVLASPVAFACGAGSVRALEAFLDRGADPEETVDAGGVVKFARETVFLPQGARLVRVACEAECEEAVRLLLDRGAAAHAASDEPWHAVPAVCRRFSAGTLRRLLDGGCSPDARGSDGTTPLCLLADMTRSAPGAAYDRALAAAGVLLDAGADPCAAAANGDTPLVRACHSRGMRFASLLISRGADPTAVGRASPLSLAAGDGADDLVRLLLDSGADASATGGDGSTAAASAVAAGHTSTLSLLLARAPGCLERATVSGESLLAVACRSRQGHAARTLLFEMGASASPHSDGCTGLLPLTAAVTAGMAPIVTELLQRGADPNGEDGFGDLPLALAVRTLPRMTGSGILDALVEAGADVNGGRMPDGSSAVLRELWRIDSTWRLGCSAMVFSQQAGVAPVPMLRYLVNKGLVVTRPDRGAVSGSVMVRAWEAYEELVQARRVEAVRACVTAPNALGNDRDMCRLVSEFFAATLSTAAENPVESLVRTDGRRKIFRAKRRK